MKRRMHAEFAQAMWNGAVPYTVFEVCQGMRGSKLEVQLFVNTSPPAYRNDWTHETVPAWLAPVSTRLGISPGGARVGALTEKRLLGKIRPGDIVYAWWASTSFINKAKALGAVVIGELVNCHHATAKRIIDGVYDDLGWSRHSDYSEQAVEAATERVHALDYVFAASPMVVDSLLDVGVPRQRVLATSYGWCPERLDRAIQPKKPKEDQAPLVAIFVGRLSIRKGIHVLLKAWAAAAIPNATLLLAGGMDEEVKEHFSSLLAAKGVEYLGHVDDMASIYSRADIFVFPSFEEGGPLVTYEAMACGLAPIVSPMGAGAIVEAGINGLVVEPSDVEGWTKAIVRLAEDRELRQTLSRNARERAETFTWKQTGERWRQLLLAALQGATPNCPIDTELSYADPLSV